MQFVNETNFDRGSTKRFSVLSSLVYLRNYTIYVLALTDYNGTTLQGNVTQELVVTLSTEAVGVPPISTGEIVDFNGVLRSAVIPMAFAVDTILPSCDTIAKSVGNDSNVM